jgi:hypothetical protein
LPLLKIIDFQKIREKVKKRTRRIWGRTK